MTKAALRRSLRATLRAVPEPQRAHWSRAAAAALYEATPARQASTVFCFVAMAWEIDTRPLLERAFAAGQTVAVPRVDPHGIEACAIEHLSQLRPSAFGILEPPTTAAPIRPETIDVAVCPGLAFTRAGARLGQGGGYYDRYLPQLRADAWTCGLGFELQVLASVPTEPHDAELQAVATEAGLWPCCRE